MPSPTPIRLVPSMWPVRIEVVIVDAPATPASWHPAARRCDEVTHVVGKPVPGEDAEAAPRESILVVEDSQVQRALLAQWLRRLGYRVLTAADGDEALRHMGATRPDLVLLDIVMPGTDGWDTRAQIRETSDVGVIMLSARGGDSDRVRGLRAGADDYLSKPFNQQELEARVEAVLRRSTAARRDPLTGLLNRRAYDEHLDMMIAHAARDLGTFTTIQIDLDHFKQINDTRGHPEGDRVLMAVARIALRELRIGEELYRVGGEEFAILITGDRNVGILVAERIRAALSRHRRHPSLPTLSAGVACFPQDGSDRVGLARAADRALYAAKESGRDRVVATPVHEQAAS